MPSKTKPNQRAEVQSAERDNHNEHPKAPREHPKYPRNHRDGVHTQEYAFAAVATGIIRAAVLGDPKLVKEMEEYDRLGREFQVFQRKWQSFERKNAGEAKIIKAWVRATCGPDGDATEAIEEQLGFVLKVIQERNLAAGQSDCWPFCNP